MLYPDVFFEAYILYATYKIIAIPAPSAIPPANEPPSKPPFCGAGVDGGIVVEGVFMLCILCWLAVVGDGCVVPSLEKLIVVSPVNGGSEKVKVVKSEWLRHNSTRVTEKQSTNE